jgi:bifunctional non-homologous end joining protein LigD
MPRKPLADYYRKRDFSKTREPRGKVGPRRGKLRYTIQKHDATRLHFDLRLEVGGVYKSWAVPKGPSLNPADKRLAVEVEDHPLEYGTFEGTIPEGQYGGGTVQLWDEGDFAPDDPERAEQDLRKGHLDFSLDGERLHGAWTLVRMEGRRDKKEKRHNWLLIKQEDRYAKEGKDIASIDKSVKTGRTMSQIAKGDSDIWDSTKPHGGLRQKKKAAPKQRLPAGKKTAAPKEISKPPFVPPQLATLRDEPPEGDGWVHEIKFDGYRIQFRIAGGEATAFSRRGLDWTGKFPELAKAMASLPDAVIDGEVVALGPNGETDFSRLQEALSREDSAGLVYYAFDLLFLEGQDLRQEPLVDRKARLEKLLAKPPRNVRYVEHFETRGSAVLKSACRLSLEGIVSKDAAAAYRSGRSDLWIKTKCSGREEFVIGGYYKDKNDRGIGALLLGSYDGDTFRYRGPAGTGFNAATTKMVLDKLKPLHRDSSPFVGMQPPRRSATRWVEPKLVAEIQYRGWTADGVLRHSSFKGLRDDKEAAEVKQDDRDVERSRESKPKKAAAKKRDSAVTITHPDKVLWPDVGVTKGDLADYYDKVADLMMRFIADRPISIVRAPDGIKGQRFFQRHASPGMSALIHGFKARGEAKPYLYIDRPEGLQALAQMGVLEIHPWGATRHHIDKPDILIFDLDPGPDVTFADLKRAAKEIRERLVKLKLGAFLKLTGGKGLHVVVPLEAKAQWPEAKAFAKALVDQMAGDSPDRYVATMSKKLRQGKIFLDYLRNDLTSTAVTAWSPRARDGAPIAVPVAWSAIERRGEMPVYHLN